MSSDSERLRHRDRAAMYAVGQRFAFDQFHDEEHMRAGFFDSVNPGDVGMIQ
jgi:hypothetical protein